MTNVNPQPPIDLGDLEPPVQGPTWPKAVGIISIVWGSLGMCCSLLGTGYFLFAPNLMKMAEQQMGGPAPQVMMPSPVQTALVAVGTLVAGLLIAAGIATTRRKAAGRMLHLTYVLVAIASTAIGTAVGWKQQVEIQKWVQENPTDKWAQQQQQGGAIGKVVFVVMTGISFAWPVFCGIWFGPMGRRPEAGAASAANLI